VSDFWSCFSCLPKKTIIISSRSSTIRASQVDVQDIAQWRELIRLDDDGRYDLRGHSLKVKVQWSRLQLRQGFFRQRVVCVWNSLPSSDVEASSVNIFKKGWTIGVRMWIFKASASRPLHLQVTSYFSILINCLHGPGPHWRKVKLWGHLRCLIAMTVVVYQRDVNRHLEHEQSTSVECQYECPCR